MILTFLAADSHMEQMRNLQCPVEKVVLKQVDRHLLASWCRLVAQCSTDSTSIKSLNFSEARSA